MVLWCFVCISWTFQIQQIQPRKLKRFSCVPGKWRWFHFQGCIFLLNKQHGGFTAIAMETPVETLRGSREWTAPWGCFLDTTEVLTASLPLKNAGKGRQRPPFRKVIYVQLWGGGVSFFEIFGTCSELVFFWQKLVPYLPKGRRSAGWTWGTSLPAQRDGRRRRSGVPSFCWLAENLWTLQIPKIFLNFAPLKINMKHNHGGLVQIIFLSTMGDL